MGKSLTEYTIDELLAEIRQRVEPNTSHPAIVDCGCPAGYQYGGCESSGCMRRWAVNTSSAAVGGYG